MAAVALLAVAGSGIGSLAGSRDALANSPTLDGVHSRGFLRCGVHRSGAGLAEINADGYWSGYFVEYCRIIAAATVGDAEAVRFVEVDDISAPLALTENLADVVISTIEPGPAGAADDRIRYLSPILVDRLTLVSAADDVDSIDELARDARICAGSHPELRRSLVSALGARLADVEVACYDSIEGLFNAFFRQRCDAISHHSFAIRSQGAVRAPGQLLNLPGVDLGAISFRPSVRAADGEWLAMVDQILRIALFRPIPSEDDDARSLSAGPIQRIRAIATTPTAVFERTLGPGGQGFDPAGSATGS